MAELIYNDDERLIKWAQDVIGCEFRADAKAIGYGNGDDIFAVTVFDGFSVCDCNMHVASDGTGHWLSRKYLLALFAYPFIQLKLRRVTGLVPARNESALRFDAHLGFEFEGRCRNALPDDDIIILGLLRENCKYIHPDHRR